MEKQLSILFNTSRNLEKSESISNPIPRKDSSAIAMPTASELGTSNLLIATQAQQNLDAVGLSSMQTSQSFGIKVADPGCSFHDQS
jgi:hypothetical protein